MSFKISIFCILLAAGSSILNAMHRSPQKKDFDMRRVAAALEETDSSDTPETLSDSSESDDLMGSPRALAFRTIATASLPEPRNEHDTSIDHFKGTHFENFFPVYGITLAAMPENFIAATPMHLEELYRFVNHYGKTKLIQVCVLMADGIVNRGLIVMKKDLTYFQERFPSCGASHGYQKSLCSLDPLFNDLADDTLIVLFKNGIINHFTCDKDPKSGLYRSYQSLASYCVCDGTTINQIWYNPADLVCEKALIIP